VERNDFDFNLSLRKPELETVSDAQAIIAASRAKYATLRAEVEAALLASLRGEVKNPEPPESSEPPSSGSKPTPKPPVAPSNFPTPPPGTVEVATPPPSPFITPSVESPKVTVSEKESARAVDGGRPQGLGRGGARHKSIQSRLKTEAHKLGFQAEVEKQLASGSNDAADLVVRRGQIEIAVEISITTGVDHEFENVKKCLVAGFKRVAVVATGRKQLEGIAAAVQGGLGSEASAKVGYHTPDEFLAELQKLAKATEAPPPSEPMAKTGKILGFEITRNFPKQSAEEQRLNQQAIHEVTLKAMKS
jgi:hypothetical protein